MAHPHVIGAVQPDGYVYERAPMIVYWELTTACALACQHCRAEAQPEPAPGELTTEQALGVLDQIADFAKPPDDSEGASSGREPIPHLVMTGGDPLRRPDLNLLISEAGKRGIGVSVAPAVTPLLTRGRLAELRELGVQTISLSLDGSSFKLHDGVRQVVGTFDATLIALNDAAAVGMPVQINTLVTADTIDDLPAIYELLTAHTLMTWSLFFLISTGRGRGLREPSPGDTERLMRWLLETQEDAPFGIRTTEAPHYRRVAAMAHERRGLTAGEIEALPLARSFGVRDGNGIVFISHRGELAPSGFMSLTVGSVLERGLVITYRMHPLMRALREPTKFKGRCGECEYNLWCGGSRARAFAHTGNPLETDPLCAYHPGSRAVSE